MFIYIFVCVWSYYYHRFDQSRTVMMLFREVQNMAVAMDYILQQTTCNLYRQAKGWCLHSECLSARIIRFVYTQMCVGIIYIYAPVVYLYYL